MFQILLTSIDKGSKWRHDVHKKDKLETKGPTLLLSGSDEDPDMRLRSPHLAGTELVSSNVCVNQSQGENSHSKHSSFKRILYVLRFTFEMRFKS